MYFKELTRHLVGHLRGADVVLGCVAWLTSHEILSALALTPVVQIVVQKEDFLRPDTRSSWRASLRERYDALTGGLLRSEVAGTILPTMSFACDPGMESVRCVGNHNSDKAPAFPRMHNKFLVLASLDTGQLVPYGVWTGSFNLTHNAGNSLENALYCTDKAIVRAYYKEYAQIAAISEPLDWTSPWAAPEWRLGS